LAGAVVLTPFSYVLFKADFFQHESSSFFGLASHGLFLYPITAMHPIETLYE
jgi:hypothetical protein